VDGVQVWVSVLTGSMLFNPLGPPVVCGKVGARRDLWPPHVRERSNHRDESSTVPVEDTSSTRMNAGIRLASIDGQREGVTYVCDEVNVLEL
jgi:hypothetical protein